MGGLVTQLELVFDSVIGLLVMLVALAIVPIMISRTILGPLSRRAGQLHAPTQFQLSDFFWLMIQLQFSLAYCVQFVGVRHRSFFVLVLGFLSLATVALWAGAVSFISRAGVISPFRRVTFVLFLLPVTLALIMSTTGALVALALTRFGFFADAYQHELNTLVAMLNISLWQIGVGLALTPVAAYLLRRVSHWVAAGMSDETVADVELVDDFLSPQTGSVSTEQV